VAIADAYDAMVHDRPYKRSIGHAAAVAELQRYATVQFDPELVALFCRLFAAEPPVADPTLLLNPPEPIGAWPARGGRRRSATA
jgi:HD-GYP domain-containing protein (c-di-GMP phosphodiesterase class II)